MVTMQEDVEKVLAGKKTSTRRNGRYADIGEIMELEGKKYEVTAIYSQSLGEMTDEDAKSEGYENMESYKNHILSLHRGMPWVPTMKVWVHEFKEV
ncbi:ASCH domain-containing protein [Anaerobacillus sp. MEB173]|uniref:ASCH domain-containing protein n=1 Tax=Anaerobacillus sp. MEB173 TaxID=3383345 RepID=UPI003F920E0D